jgi:hypothetical protein
MYTHHSQQITGLMAVSAIEPLGIEVNKTGQQQALFIPNKQAAFTGDSATESDLRWYNI